MSDIFQSVSQLKTVVFATLPLPPLVLCKCKLHWLNEKIHCRIYSQISMRGGWWGRQNPVLTIQVSLGARKWPKCMFSKLPDNLSPTNPSLHYPTVFGLHEMPKMCVLHVAYQSFHKKPQFALSKCLWVAWNVQNVCFTSCLSIFP